MEAPDPPRLAPRDLWQFDSLTRGLILGLCLTDEDLSSLVDCVDAAECFTRSPSALRREQLQVNCRRSSGVCRRVSNLLDARHAEAVEFVHRADLPSVTETLDSCLRVGLQPELPGLLWAVGTDPRPEMQELTRQLANEIMARACDIIREVVDFSERTEY